MRYLLLLVPFVLVALSALPKVLIQRSSKRQDDEAIEAYRETLVQYREPTFEERWDASDDEFMRRWSAFSSLDLQAHNDALVERFAQEAEEVIQVTAERIRWTYDHLACHFIRADTTVELTAAYLVMKADGVDFDALRERCDPNTDTMVWTEEMEQELTNLLREEVVV